MKTFRSFRLLDENARYHPSVAAVRNHLKTNGFGSSTSKVKGGTSIHALSGYDYDNDTGSQQSHESEHKRLEKVMKTSPHDGTIKKTHGQIRGTSRGNSTTGVYSIEPNPELYVA